jgi:hypothetical protein
MKNPLELEYYATPGPMTDLVSSPDRALEGLPREPLDLMKVVRGCVADVGTFTQIYDHPLPVGRDGEKQIRPAAEMLECILRLDPAPLVEQRPPQQRFLGTCRNFATLTCALLRHTGTPARVRAGFAGYFVPDTWMDHWIVEYWRPADERWVRVDPEYGDEWFQERDPDATSESVAERLYLSGGETWQRCRRGEIDANRCNMGGANWGIGEVRGAVLYDTAALNQDEMLPWDVWGQMEAAYRGETDAAYDALLDTVGDIVASGDFDRIRALYESEEVLRVPVSLLGQ